MLILSFMFNKTHTDVLLFSGGNEKVPADFVVFKSGNQENKHERRKQISRSVENAECGK